MKHIRNIGDERTSCSPVLFSGIGWDGDSQRHDCSPNDIVLFHHLAVYMMYDDQPIPGIEL